MDSEFIRDIERTEDNEEPSRRKNGGRKMISYTIHNHSVTQGFFPFDWDMTYIQ